MLAQSFYCHGFTESAAVQSCTFSAARSAPALPGYHTIVGRFKSRASSRTMVCPPVRHLSALRPRHRAAEMFAFLPSVEPYGSEAMAAGAVKNGWNVVTLPFRSHTPPTASPGPFDCGPLAEPQ